MGNRGVITFAADYEAYKANGAGMGVYVHWNGGCDSVRAFADYCKLRGVRSPGNDSTYAYARLVQVISNFFGGNLSIGVGKLSELDLCGDNGTFIVNNDWKVFKNIILDDYNNPIEKKVRSYMGCKQLQKHRDFLIEIDKAQPENGQLGKEFLRAEEVSPSELKVGDWVFGNVSENWHYNVSCDYELVARPFKYQIKGFSDNPDLISNGRRVFGVPYYYTEYGHPVYLFHKTVRKANPPTLEERNWQYRMEMGYDSEEWLEHQEAQKAKDSKVENQYALTIVYHKDMGESDDAVYLHKSFEEAQAEAEQVIKDGLASLKEAGEVIQTQVKINSSKTRFVLFSREPHEMSYAPYMSVAVSKIYF